MQDIVEDSELPKPRGESNFLKGSEFAGKLVSANVKEVGETTFSDGRSVRNLLLEIPAIGERRLSLNKTNVAAMMQNFGKNVKAWVGQSIKLTTTKANNPTTGQLVDSIIIIAG